MNLSNNQDLIKSISLPLGLATIYLLLKEIWETIFNTILVNPILSKVESNLVNDSIFVSLLILLLFNLYRKYNKNYYITNKTLFTIIIVVLFYIYYRFISNMWNFTGFSFVNNIKYLDILLLFPLGLLFLKIIHNNTPLETDDKKGFYLDTPLGKSNPDLLNRESLAKYISSEIENTNSPESSFAIGISSEWGFGKTSFFDLIERYLNCETNIIIKVNPWINHDSRNIVKDFFFVLSSSLSKYSSNISPTIKKYVEILVGIGGNDLNKILNPLVKIYSSNDNVLSEFEQINSSIKNLNKKLVVFIDDLDRLYKEEIIQVVKLIRNSANFGNTIFVVAYDRNYIVNAIKGINSYNPEFFLEKIFQIEIRLPNFEEQIIQKQIFELLSPRILETDNKELLNILLKKNVSFNTSVFNSGTLTTLRDATRFSNSFLIAYSYLKGEIVLADLLNIEALRLKYPGVYKLIFFQSDEFLVTASSTYNKTFYSLRTKKTKEKDNSEVEKVLIREYLIENFDKVGIPKSDIDKAISLLYSLFPKPDSQFYSRDVDLLSVANPSSFERYSHYRLLDTNLSEIEFSKYRSKPLNEFCEKIKEWVESGLRWELKRRFESINAFSDKEDFEKTINAIFYFARLPKIENINNDYSGFDYDNLYGKIYNYQEYIKLKYYSNVDEYKAFIVSIFKTAPSPYSFDVEFIYSTFDKFSITYDFIIPKEVFEHIRLDYLEKYLNETSKFNSNIWHLYVYNDDITALPQSGSSYQIQKSKNPKATKLVIDFIRNKDLDGFLFEIIAEEPRDKGRFAISEIIPKMFGSYKTFEDFIEEFKNKDYKFLKEFKDFYKKLNEHEYKRYIEFNFKDIPVKKLH